MRKGWVPYFRRKRKHEKEKPARGCRHCDEDQAVKNGHYTRNVRRITGTTKEKVQRWKCKICGKTFSTSIPGVGKWQRFDNLVHRLVLSGKCVLNGTLRKTKEFFGSVRVRIGKSTAWLWINKHGEKAGELVDGTKPGFSGYLGIDEVWVRFKKKGVWNYGLLAVDKVHKVILKLERHEQRTEEEWEKFLRSIAWKAYPRVKLVSHDLLEDIYPLAIRKVFDSAEIQPCTFHFAKTINKHLKDLGVNNETREEIRNKLSKCFGQKKAEEAEETLDEVVSQLAGIGCEQSMQLVHLWKNDLFNYKKHGVSGTNNEAEHVFAFFKPNYKPVKTYRSGESIQNQFDLYTWYYNNREFDRGENAGKTPYELAGLHKMDWLDELGLKL